jgi:hypothetical protein
VGLLTQVLNKYHSSWLLCNSQPDFNSLALWSYKLETQLELRFHGTLRARRGFGQGRLTAGTASTTRQHQHQPQPHNWPQQQQQTTTTTTIQQPQQQQQPPQQQYNNNSHSNNNKTTTTNNNNNM